MNLLIFKFGQLSQTFKNNILAKIKETHRSDSNHRPPIHNFCNYLPSPLTEVSMWQQFGARMEVGAGDAAWSSNEESQNRLINTSR